MSGSFWGGMLLALVVILILVIWSIRRHRDPSLQIDCDDTIDKLMPTLAGLTLGTAVAGNKVEVHRERRILRHPHRAHPCGTPLCAFRDVPMEGRAACPTSGRRADRPCQGGRTSARAAGRTGLQGSGESLVQRMRSAGCRVMFFHERALRNIGVLNDRDHRKLVIIDGSEAFVGGHCIVDEWLGNAEDGEHYADVSLHLHGPIVHSLQSAFSENWAGETGELFVGDGVFPELDPAGDVLIHAVFAKPENSAPA